MEASKVFFVYSARVFVSQIGIASAMCLIYSAIMFHGAQTQHDSHVMVRAMVSIFIVRTATAILPAIIFSSFSWGRGRLFSASLGALMTALTVIFWLKMPAIQEGNYSEAISGLIFYVVFFLLVYVTASFVVGKPIKRHS